jgi:hypothetical protein
MSATLDHTGPLDAVEDADPTLLVVLVLALLMVRALLVVRVGVEVVIARVEVCRLGLLAPFEETTR